MSAFVYRCAAVGRNVDLKTAQIGIVGGKQYAGIRGKAAKNELFCVQALEQKIQRRLEKARMPRLENKIIILLRSKLTGDRSSADTLFYTTRHEMFEIGLPLSEVVVHVQTGNAEFLGFSFKGRDVSCHWRCVFNELLSALEFQIIDDID